MGEAGNGLYGSATWKWFIDVDYHYDNPSMNINDFDNNGTVDMCNSSYEIDCEQVGVTGDVADLVGDLLMEPYCLRAGLRQE